MLAASQLYRLLRRQKWWLLFTPIIITITIITTITITMNKGLAQRPAAGNPRSGSIGRFAIWEGLPDG